MCNKRIRYVGDKVKYVCVYNMYVLEGNKKWKRTFLQIADQLIEVQGSEN